MNFSHLKETGENYFSHMFFSLKMFAMLTVLSWVALFHSIIPFAFTSFVSSKLETLSDVLIARSEGG